MFRFIHAADLHLDSPLRGLERYEGAPVDEIRGATRRALERLVDLALAESVAFVVIAGDLYDGDWRDYNTGLYFVDQMRRLRAEAIPVFIVSGNHDAASQLTKTLRLPENVHLFSPREPETVTVADLDVAIHGRSFPTRAVSDDLAAGFPAPQAHSFNIGVLHTSVTGREGHEPYAPCTLEALRAHGYHYWALGHVHTREVLSEDPWVVFPGNTQGRHVRECGAKGCTLVTVEERQVTAVEHRDLDVLRWGLCTVDLTDAADDASVLERLHAALLDAANGLDRPLALRLHLTGACPAHSMLLAQPDTWLNHIRALATDVGGGQVWVEAVKTRTEAVERPSAATVPDGLLAALAERAVTDDDLAALEEEVRDLRLKLPEEFRTGDDGLDPADPTVLRAALADARALLEARLFAAGGTA